MIDADVLIIGGGIAGAAAAYEIAAFASVIVLERESHCGYHSTGRSAATFSENYGSAVVRRLAIASREFLDGPPPGFCEHPLLTPQASITIARSDQLEMLTQQLDQGRRLVPSIERIAVADAVSLVPILRADYVAGAYIEPHSMEIDVHGLHQGFLKGAKARGARVVIDAGVGTVERQGERWVVTSAAGAYRAPLIINAAGAWADVVAAMAGTQPLGLVPKRRTAFHVALPPGLDARGWPMVDDVGEEFYFKPDAGRLFVSPADATASPPVDAYPEDLDVAAGVERLERATTLNVNRVTRSWAGLRTFAADGSPVVGLDDRIDGFCWLAGQGGYGIKTSPALARACADLIRGRPLPDELTRLGISANDLSPARLRRTTA
jgi:D-arginine dehydrogenase